MRRPASGADGLRPHAALTDRDQASIAEARRLARARAGRPSGCWPSSRRRRSTPSSTPWPPPPPPHAEPLARLAVEETGYGVVADKVQKNLFAARDVHAFIRPMKTVGVVARHDDRRIIEIAEPFGVVAAIVPSTNPTSTAIYKLLIAHQGALRDRHQPASLGRALHHAHRGADDTTRRAAPGCPTAPSAG